MPVEHVENLLLPSFLPTPLLLRGEEKRLMVLASSREDGAPKVYHSSNKGNALGYIMGVARIFQGGVQFAEILLTTPTFLKTTPIYS